MTASKTCKHCRQIKELKEFPVSHRRKDGTPILGTVCQPCKSAQKREWRQHKGERQLNERERAAKYSAEKQEASVPTATQYAQIWTEQDEQTLLDNWEMPLADLAVLLGRTYTAVARRRVLMQKRGRVDSAVPQD